MDDIRCRSAIGHTLSVLFIILAVAALLCFVPMVSDESDAASSYSSYGNLKIDGVNYSLDPVKLEATATSCDFSRTEIVIQDEISDQNLTYKVTDCDIFFSSMYMTEHITYGKYVKNINSKEMGGCQYLKTVTIRGDSGISDLGSISDIKTLEAINVADINTTFSSVDGVLFDKSKQNLCVYPAAKSSSTFEIPDYLNYIYESSGFKTNTHLKSITGSSSAFTSNNGILYNSTQDKLIVCPAGYSGDKLVIPEGVTAAEFPVDTSVREIVIPSTFIRVDMEWGFVAGVLKITADSLPAAGTPYSIIFEETKDVPDVVKNVAGDYRIYKIDIGGQTAFNSPVTVTFYGIKYRASNLHVYNISADGTATDVDLISRATTGAVVKVSQPGYYTYGFNDDTAIENAELIALAIAAAGTLFAVIAVIRGIGGKH